MGSSATFELREFKIASGDSTKCFTGDPVKYLTTGYVSQWSNGTAVSQLGGIFVGCEYFSIALGRRIRNNYWPGSDASGDVSCKIIPIQGALPMEFEVQCDSTGAAFSDLYGNVDVTLGTGNTTTGQSAAFVALSVATTTTLPFRILNLKGTGGQGNVGPGTQSGAYNIAIVTANVYGATGLS